MSNSANQMSYGSPIGNFQGYALKPIPAQRAPTTADKGYQVGQLWVYEGHGVYGFVGITAGDAIWELLATAAGTMVTLSDTSDTTTSPDVDGNIQISGTANEVSVVAGSSLLTVGIPDTFVFGSAAGSNSGTINTGTGGLNCQLTNGPFIVSTGTGQIDISSDVTNTTVNVGIASGSSVKTVNVGSPHSTSITTIAAGSAGIVLNAVGGSTSCTTDFSLSSVATKISMNGGAVTDFIGTGVLTSGTVTIANTNIAAGDRILLSRIASNGSTTLGEYTYAITPATNFIVTSAIIGTPGSTQTGDTSTFCYVIFRQT
jgi:hypothetical protein